MAFLESRIDARITRECSFELHMPERIKVYAAGGRMVQKFGNSLSKTYVDMSHGMRSAAAFRAVQDAFYVVMFTPYEGLRVRNWADYLGTQANTTVRLVSGATYQLQRRHTFGGINFDRDIKKPVSGTITVYNGAGAALVPTIDYTTGTFTVASGTPATWAGEFDLPMTFKENVWTAQLAVHTNNLHVVSGAVVMEELRL